MDTISYLLELIETKKNVGITGLGTLYIKKMPGRYDAEAHTFLPPKHEIAFTSEVIEEAELVNFISEKRNSATESAAKDITDFVANIKALLAEHQYADISPLGAFKIINDQIEFEPSKKFQVGLDFYGLPNIPTVDNSDIEEPQPILQEQNEESPADINEQLTEQLSSVEEQEAVPQFINNEQQDDQPVYEEIGEVTAPPPITDPIWRPTVNDRYEYNTDDEDDENETRGRGKRIFLKTLLILFIIAIAAAVVYFFYPDLLNNLLQNHPDQQIENASAIVTDTSSTQKIDSAFADSVNKTINFAKPTKDIAKIDSIIPGTSYEVIGSAMKSKKKVKEVIGNFVKRGINAKAIDALPGRLIKISLGSFADYNLAKKFQDSLKIKLKNPEIYIQTIKPKN